MAIFSYTALVDGMVLTAADINTPLSNAANATVPVANGGTGLTAGTSGGVLYYSAAGTLASSNALTASALVLGGGAGAAPSSLALGTANRVLGMTNAATGHEYKTISAGTAAGVTHAANSIALGLGIALAGANDTEGTTTNTSTADIVTVSSLSIPVTSPVLVICNYRKSAGHASASQIGLKINSTDLGTMAATSATNQAESGVMMFLLGPQDSSYLRAGFYLGAANPGFGTTLYQTALAANLPNAAITSITIEGLSGNAANTTAVKYVKVYALQSS